MPMSGCFTVLDDCNALPAERKDDLEKQLNDSVP